MFKSCILNPIKRLTISIMEQSKQRTDWKGRKYAGDSCSCCEETTAACLHIVFFNYQEMSKPEK